MINAFIIVVLLLNLVMIISMKLPFVKPNEKNKGKSNNDSIRKFLHLALESFML